MGKKFEIFSLLLCYSIIIIKELTNAAELKKPETEYAKRGEIPYIVSIRRTDKEKIAYGHHICGGVIVDEKKVVTAAHCLVDKVGKHLSTQNVLTIVAGTVHRTKKMGNEIIRKSAKIFLHPGFNFLTKRHNLAVITLNKPLPLDGKSTRSASLSRTEFPEGTQCTISGWGSTNDKVSDQLRKAKVYIMPKDECVSNYAEINYAISETEICTGLPEGGTRSCYGDNGGPLVCNNSLYGISSFGFGCGFRGFPAVYSNLKAYKNFIETPSKFLDAFEESEDEENEFDEGLYEREVKCYRIALFTLILLFVFFMSFVWYSDNFKINQTK